MTPFLQCLFLVGKENIIQEWKTNSNLSANSDKVLGTPRVLCQERFLGQTQDNQKKKKYTPWLLTLGAGGSMLK